MLWKLTKLESECEFNGKYFWSVDHKGSTKYHHHGGIWSSITLWQNNKVKEYGYFNSAREALNYGRYYGLLPSAMLQYSQYIPESFLAGSQGPEVLVAQVNHLRCLCRTTDYRTRVARVSPGIPDGIIVTIEELYKHNGVSVQVTLREDSLDCAPSFVRALIVREINRMRSMLGDPGVPVLTRIEQVHEGISIMLTQEG